ncbi:calmodulin-binding transcription activator 1 isoform X35 [Equus asinus]|uniref:Calmodulin-binding transcription activator 1 isoform X50 n=1 Tax=Equus przewalskii TaxID=9798 RepID=A0ABM4NQ70_EQUPR|nr:calmodulin-binding transcription activator 1 isoform X11 [Equus caballus]XP_057551095.1 calmodulin-binding transcription activator 1 isoform X8 [Hippopotamus amphibius kiboko]XP_057551105.1 calmodulin-binding transcription activator 1 isoform X8 [Hippopotamus amphibius kiboko]
MWRAEGKWLPKTSRKSVSQSVFCGTSTYCVLNTVPPIEDDHGNSNSSHVKIFLPKKLLECLPKCSSLPKERHRWNTNERSWCSRPFGFLFNNV